MRKLQAFTGINNVLPVEEIGDSALSVGSNIDLDLVGRARRRDGFAEASDIVHRNVWKTVGGALLATRGDDGDLVNVDTDTVLLSALGHTRVWWHNLPDGRTLYANGTAQGVVNAAASGVASWGVPIPSSVGVADDAAGSLYPGDYQWAISHVRLADGIEGGPAYSTVPVAVSSGGVALTGLPVLTGYRTNVYLTSHFGGERYLAGSTTGSTFTFAGANSDLVLPCRVDFMRPAPIGKLVSFWRGRALVAVGNALFASRPNNWELFDLQRDFKQFSGAVTLVQPTDGGIWVGTDKELAFLSGDTWDKLVRIVKVAAGVVLGSGCSVPGEHITRGERRAEGDCMICVADGWLVAGLPDGTIVPLSVDRYKVTASELTATFRVVDGVPQYLAAVQ